MPRANPKKSAPKKANRVQHGAVAGKNLAREFPQIALPIRPPFPPAEAKSVSEIPQGPGWLYEPKWDGFRCIVFRSGKQVVLQSKAGQPLERYFPEMVQALMKLRQARFVLDGEIVIYVGRHLSFDDLLMRIHPAASRVRKLAAETPATYMCFDLLVDEKGKALVPRSLAERRDQLKTFFQKVGTNERLRLSPASKDRAQAERWMRELAKMGLDGIVAKKLDEPYHSGERIGMVKVKGMRTADVVVGGFRYAEKGRGIGSLLLGLYDDEGKLDHVGFTSSFNAEQRRDLKKIVEPLIGKPGFSGRAPGGPSRWSTKRSSEWQPLKNDLVAEVRYDHFSQGRFRHGTKFLRWRPEKNPKACTFEQVRTRER